MAFLEFGLFRYFLFFPFIHPIFCSLRAFIKKKLILQEVNTSYYSNYLFFFKIFTYHISLLFQIFPEIISRIRQKRKKFVKTKKLNKNSNLILRIYSNFNLKVFLFLLLSSVLFYSNFGIKNEDNYLYLGRFTLIFWLGFWSFFILNIKIYSHQIIGIILIIFGSIILIIINLKNNTNSLTSFGVITLFSSYAIFCLSITIKKYLLEKYFVSPFLILLIEGILGLIIDFTLTYSLIEFNVINQEKINSFINEVTTQKFYLLLYIICEGISQMCVIITNYYFSPTMIGVSDSLSVFFENFFTKEKKKYYGYLTIIIGCFIYNELIILKFCHFEMHTEKYISSRSAIDCEKFLDYNNDTDTESEVFDMI